MHLGFHLLVFVFTNDELLSRGYICPNHQHLKVLIVSVNERGMADSEVDIEAIRPCGYPCHHSKSF